MFKGSGLGAVPGSAGKAPGPPHQSEGFPGTFRSQFTLLLVTETSPAGKYSGSPGGSRGEAPCLCWKQTGYGKSLPQLLVSPSGLHNSMHGFKLKETNIHSLHLQTCY